MFEPIRETRRNGYAVLFLADFAHYGKSFRRITVSIVGLDGNERLRWWLFLQEFLQSRALRLEVRILAAEIDVEDELAKRRHLGSQPGVLGLQLRLRTTRDGHGAILSRSPQGL
jgi:hypothetical protein